MSRLIILLLAAACFFPAAAHAGKATVYRDNFGIPHIYADSPAEAAYGLGYAAAEDRLEDIYENVRIAIGNAAEFFGEKYLETDYGMKLVRNAEFCQKHFETAPELLRLISTGYVEGIKAFAAEHPERVPEWKLDLEPWHPAAIGRAMVLRWPLGTLMDDLNGKPEKPEFTSNEMAIAPSRTADKCAVLLTDPHLSWENLAVFHEARVHIGDPKKDGISMCGFFILGSPLLGLGHSAHVAWAMTTGGPDTSDVYMLKLNPAIPTQYEYEGKWEYMKPRFIRIPVKGEAQPRQMPAMDTRFGPLMAEPDTKNNVAYAGKTPYMESSGMFEQTWAMITAKNAEEFYQALKMNQLMEQNLMYADRAGTIGYARVGRTPIRPEGYDWSRPVPGHTKATEWLGLYDIDDHVRIVNPPTGYMQNCNISPANMFVGSPMTADKYSEHVYNVSWDKNNPRGKRMTALLDADTEITKEEAIAITMDVYDILAKPWQDALKAANDAHGAEVLTDTDCKQAMADLLAWDGQFEQTSVAAPVMERLRLATRDHIDVAAIADGKPLSAEDQKELLSILHAQIEEMKKLYGKAQVTWGEVHVVGRNGNFYPYDGADFGGGPTFTETVRDVDSSEQPKGSGKYVADGGCGSTLIAFLYPDRIESYSSVPWGVSNQPSSPHHTDQAREIFSKRKMKPTYFYKDDLLKVVSSEKVLTTP